VPDEVLGPRAPHRATLARQLLLERARAARFLGAGTAALRE
jgi:hypothetical protein